MRGAALALALLAGSGCLAPSGEPASDAPRALAFGAPVPVSKEWPGAEPVIAAAPDGTLYVEGIGRQGNGNVNKVWRSDDAGATWTDVTPPDVGEERSNDGYVAVADDGTVYAANVFSLTFQLFRSDDRGATWTRLQPPRVPTAMHRHWIVPVGDTVHVTVEALPPAFAPFVAGVPPPTSELGTPNEGMWYTRSADGGATWRTPVQIDPVVNFAGQSNMVVSEDGARLYVARYEEDRDPTAYTYDDGRFYLLASEDSGDTWERREMFALDAETSTAVPGLALDAAGTLYLVWSQEDAGSSRLRWAFSKDGLAWTEVVPDLPPGTHAMAWGAARAAGELDLLWYAADAAGVAREVDADWYVDAARVTAADTPSPRVERVRVTPDVVHVGNICARGPACRAGEDRSLLDYPWLDHLPDGRAALAFPSTAWERPSAFAVVAVETR